MPDQDRMILVGAVTGAHGVRGEVKIRSFTADPRAVARYGEVCDCTGARKFAIRLRGMVRGMVVARLAGIEDRNAAEALKGLELYVPRVRFPRARREEWYVTDLVGLTAQDGAGRTLGRVVDVANYGAGDVIEIRRDDGETLLLPFTRRAVPVVDLEARRIVIDPPIEVEARAGDMEAAS
jgi:16S rRNA processing protein RimM